MTPFRSAMKCSKSAKRPNFIGLCAGTETENAGSAETNTM